MPQTSPSTSAKVLEDKKEMEENNNAIKVMGNGT